LDAGISERAGLLSSVKLETACRSHRKDVLNDVNNAKALNLRLSEMIFAASVPRDASVQEYARELSRRVIDNARS
jgi:hypothetical protein